MTGSFNTQPPASRPRPAQTRFNTQPTHPAHVFLIQFQHTAARRRLGGWLVIVIVGFRFQHTAARRRLEINQFRHLSTNTFQHTAARRRLARMNSARKSGRLFQHTAARRRLGDLKVFDVRHGRVSTHSRPKAAGNSSPAKASDLVFQHTAARRRLALDARGNGQYLAVSTHSRPKAAGVRAGGRVAGKAVSTHSRPKAAGWRHGCRCHFYFCFNTQPPEGGWGFFVFADGCRLRFQHTAARRRLVLQYAAGRPACPSFNTQPPEGGW